MNLRQPELRPQGLLWKHHRFRCIPMLLDRGRSPPAADQRTDRALGVSRASVRGPRAAARDVPRSVNFGMHGTGSRLAAGRGHGVGGPHGMCSDRGWSPPAPASPRLRRGKWMGRSLRGVERCGPKRAAVQSSGGATGGLAQRSVPISILLLHTHVDEVN